MKITTYPKLTWGLKPEIYSELSILLGNLHLSTIFQIEKNIEVSGKNANRTAKAFIKRLDAELKSKQIDFRMMDRHNGHITNAANNIANIFSELLNNTGNSSKELIYCFYSYHNHDAIPRIYLTSHQLTTAKEHLNSSDWWVTKIYKAIDENIEALAARLGFVGKFNSHYVSDNVLRSERNKEYFNSQKLEKKPDRNKRNYYENLTLLTGIEKYATKNKMTMVFITITAPSVYHLNSKSWNGNLPKQSHDLIAANWNEFNTKVRKCKAASFSFRIAEPHKDGTQHWHVILWVSSKDSKKFKNEFFTIFQAKGWEKKNIKWKLIRNFKERINKISYVLKSLEIRHVFNEDEHIVKNLKEKRAKNELLERQAICNRFWRVTRWRIAGLPKGCKELWRTMYSEKN